MLLRNLDQSFENVLYFEIDVSENRCKFREIHVTIRAKRVYLMN